MNTLQEIFQKALVDAVRTLASELADELIYDESILSTHASDVTAHGDYASVAALRIATRLSKDPMNVAQELLKVLKSNPAIAAVVVRLDVSKPGYINFTLKDEWLKNQLPHILSEGSAYGASSSQKGTKVQVEFISANPTGPLTLANGRGGVIGDTLANVLAHAGATVEREYYINDAGRQIRILGESVLARAGLIEAHEDHYQGAYIDDLAHEFHDTVGRSKNNAEELGRMLAAHLLEHDIKPVIARMGIHFDSWYSEYREVHAKKRMEEFKKLLGPRMYERDGAVWLKTSQEGDDKDRVLVTTQGEPTYFAADILHHLDAYGRGFNRINVVGADHHGYVGRIDAASRMLPTHPKCTHTIIMQLVRLIRESKEVKMSKRAGVYVTLDELLNEVGADVVRFFFLTRSPEVHMDFDLDLAKKQSRKNPVYRVQYAHARIASILKKIESSPLQSFDASTYHPEAAERALLVTLERYPELVRDVAKNYHVHALPTYALLLADTLHWFYEKNKVIENGRPHPFRVDLIKATQIVLRNVLRLMGISAPETM